MGRHPRAACVLALATLCCADGATESTPEPSWELEVRCNLLFPPDREAPYYGSLSWRDSGAAAWTAVALDTRGRAQVQVRSPSGVVVLRYAAKTGEDLCVPIPVGAHAARPSIDRVDWTEEGAIVDMTLTMPPSVEVRLRVPPEDEGRYFALAFPSPCPGVVDGARLWDATSLLPESVHDDSVSGRLTLAPDTEAYIGVYREDGSLVIADPEPFLLDAGQAIVVSMGLPR